MQALFPREINTEAHFSLGRQTGRQASRAKLSYNTLPTAKSYQSERERWRERSGKKREREREKEGGG